MTAKAAWGENMKKFWLVGLALATTLAIAPAAQADTTFYVYLSGSDFSAVGTFTGTSSGSEYNITGGSLNFGNTFFNPSSGSIGTVVPPPAVCTGSPVCYLDFTAGYTYTATQPPSGLPTNHDFMYFDSIFGTTSPYVDGNGILLTLNNGETINIFSVSGVDYVTDYYNGSWLPNTDSAPGGYPVSLYISETPETPEPSSFLLFGTGLLCMAGFLFRKSLPGMIRAE
jgi:hypothetical protein